MSDNKVKLKNQVMYGMGDICGGGVSLLIGMLYLDFLTGPAVELSAKGIISAGTVLLIGKVAGGILNIIFGHWSDRTRSRFGRRRRYFLWASAPIFISFALMWNPYIVADSAQLSKFLFFMLSYLVYCASFSMAFVNYTSIIPDMTDDYKTRSSMIGYKTAFGGLSAVASAIIPILLIQNMENLMLAYTLIGFVYGLLYSLPWLIVFFGTFERRDIEYPESKLDPIADLRSAFMNKAYRNFMVIWLACNATGDFILATAVFYLKFVLFRYNDFVAVVGIILIINIVTVPIYTKIANLKGKTMPLKIGGIFITVGLLLSLFLRPDAGQPEYWLYIVIVLAAIGISSANLVPMSLLQDIADIDELISTKRRSAMFASYASAIRQVMLGVIGFVISQSLGFSGFIEGMDWEKDVQPDSAILTTRILFSVVPIICMAFAYIGAYKYKLSDDRHKKILAEIERLKAGGKKEDADPDVKKLCEEVSGLSHNLCWNPENADVKKMQEK